MIKKRMSEIENGKTPWLTATEAPELQDRTKKVMDPRRPTLNVDGEDVEECAKHKEG